MPLPCYYGPSISKHTLTECGLFTTERPTLPLADELHVFTCSTGYRGHHYPSTMAFLTRTPVPPAISARSYTYINVDILRFLREWMLFSFPAFGYDVDMYSKSG